MGRTKRATRQSFVETKSKRQVRKPSQQKHRPEMKREAPISQLEDDIACVPYDEALLDVCRTRWQFGDWFRLAAIEPEMLLYHPDRAKIALLSAAANFQLSQSQQGHRQLQLALDWGASRRQVMRVLISGIHNSIAVSNFLLGNPERAREHFREAIHTGGVPGDTDLLAQAREARCKS